MLLILSVAIRFIMLSVVAQNLKAVPNFANPKKIF